MTLYNFTDEQRQETIKLLMNIQLHMPWKKARCECDHMNEAIKGICEILDMVKQQETTRKIYNPVTGTYYNIKKSVCDGKVKGIWGKKDDTP